MQVIDLDRYCAFYLQIHNVSLLPKTHCPEIARSTSFRLCSLCLKSCFLAFCNNNNTLAIFLLLFLSILCLRQRPTRFKTWMCMNNILHDTWIDGGSSNLAGVCEALTCTPSARMFRSERQKHHKYYLFINGCCYFAARRMNALFSQSILTRFL